MLCWTILNDWMSVNLKRYCWKVTNDSRFLWYGRKNVRLDQPRGKEGIGTPGSKGVSKSVSKRMLMALRYHFPTSGRLYTIGMQTPLRSLQGLPIHPRTSKETSFCWEPWVCRGISHVEKNPARFVPSANERSIAKPYYAQYATTEERYL
jgi:hypothetical protein